MRIWIPLAFAISVLSMLIYVSIQQTIRIGANDPQIQMAEDGAAALSRGATPRSVLPAKRVDVAASLAPYMVIYGEDEKTVASSAILDGETPTLPDGVLAYTKAHGEDRVTWQPRSGVRSAIIVRYFKGGQPGFVMTGRSLRETEKRTNALLLLMVAAWLAALIGTFVVSFILELIRERFAE